MVSDKFIAAITEMQIQEKAERKKYLLKKRGKNANKEESKGN